MKTCLLLMVTCFAMLPAWAQPKSPDFAQVDEQIQQWMDAGKYPGAGLWIVSKDGQTLHERYWGGYDRQTRVMMASSTKWLEAATMMTLVDDGNLSWTSRFLPIYLS